MADPSIDTIVLKEPALDYPNAFVLQNGTNTVANWGLITGPGTGTVQIDIDLSTLLAKAGGTMAGDIAMGGHNISGIGTATAATISGTSSVLTPFLNLDTPILTVNGSVSGHAYWNMSQQGSGPKRVTIDFEAFNDAGHLFTFPVAFTHTPDVSANPTTFTALGAYTLISASLTTPAINFTGVIEIIGF